MDKLIKLKHQLVLAGFLNHQQYDTLLFNLIFSEHLRKITAAWLRSQPDRLTKVATKSRCLRLPGGLGQNVLGKHGKTGSELESISQGKQKS